jgi:hypothetical protein
MNTNLIMKNIDLTKDVFSQNHVYKNKHIKEVGFNYIVGYLDIIKSLNKMTSLEVSIIIKELRDEGGQYRDFANHIVSDKVLSHDVFESDDNFTNEKEKIKQKDNNSIDKKYELMYNIYQKNNENNTSKDLQKDFYEKIKTKLEKNHKEEEKLYFFKKNMDSYVLNWLEKNLKHMNPEEFYMFLEIIHKIKYD